MMPVLNLTFEPPFTSHGRAEKNNLKRLPQPSNPFLDLCHPDRGKAQAQSGWIRVMGEERRAGHKGHASLDGAFGKVGRIAVPAPGASEFGPEEHAALGLVEFNRAAQLAAQGFGHDTGAFGIGFSPVSYTH